jgi:hypothetical protein
MLAPPRPLLGPGAPACACGRGRGTLIAASLSRSGDGRMARSREGRCGSSRLGIPNVLSPAAANGRR